MYSEYAVFVCDKSFVNSVVISFCPLISAVSKIDSIARAAEMLSVSEMLIDFIISSISFSFKFMPIFDKVCNMDNLI